MYEIVFDNESPTKRKCPLLSGMVVSSTVHLGVVLALIVVPMTFWLADTVSWDERAITVVTGPPRDEQPPKPAVRLVTDASEVSGELVERRLNEVIVETQKRDEQDNLDKLAKLVGRLETMSSDKSVDRMASTLNKWLGTEQRATMPAEKPVAGEFDYDTAQLHDVRREKTEDGKWRYWTVMLDAKGRTIEVEVEEAEGETFYKTMQRIKAFPLAEKVYRQITMPLIDKLMKSRQTTAPKPAEETVPVQVDDSVEE